MISYLFKFTAANIVTSNGIAEYPRRINLRLFLAPKIIQNIEVTKTDIPIYLIENKYEKIATGKKRVIPSAFRETPNEFVDKGAASPISGRAP